MFEGSQLASLQSEFQDVYARSEFDVRNFTILEHEIDTGDVAPVTRRVQRKSAFFAGKEAHFKKMLDARVIQPSISAWALFPGLIRKKDRQVRWCLDITTLIK